MLLALASATALTPPAVAGTPQWVQLLPAGEIGTIDGRGPYRVADAAKLAADSLQAAGGKLAIDENHSTDLAAPNGGPSPARGWIVALDARPDGIWGQVEWNASGQALLADKAYRGISPVFMHDKQNNVLRILRASLVNNPNLRGLAALHQAGGNSPASPAEQSTMDQLLSDLRKALGIANDADQNTVMTKIKSLMSGAAMHAAQLKPIATALRLAEDADAEKVLAAIKPLVEAKPAEGGDKVVVALQAELKTVTEKFTALQTQLATDKATAFVDAAIAAGRVGVKPLREHYIAQHAIDAGRVEKEINAMPLLGPSGALAVPPAKDNDGTVALNAEQAHAAKVLGLKPDDYRKTLAAEAAEEEAA